jgi:16S rRNA processing protein RimM
MAKTKGSGANAQPEPEFLEIARVLRPWGIRGEMKVELLTANLDDLAGAKRVYLGAERTPFEVRGVRLQGRAPMLKLAGCDTPEQVDALRGLAIHIPRSQAAPLRPRQYYHYQIVGLHVFTVDGEALGDVVEIVETGAHDVYVVHGSRGDVLVPARVEFVKQVDLNAGRMIVALLPGMLPD